MSGVDHAGAVKWLDAQCDDESANERFREVRHYLDTLRAQLEAAQSGPVGELVEALRARAEAAEAEVAEMRKRMHFLATDGCVEGFANVTSDMYDLAADSAEEAGRDEPNDDDLIDGLCDLIDLARTKEQQA